MTGQLSPLERTIRGALPSGVVADEDGVARRIAHAVEVLHLAGLHAQIAAVEAERDAAYRMSLGRLARELRAEIGGAA